MQSKSPPFLPALWRLLTFKITREEVLQFGNRELIFGLLCVWLVGMGRSWDNPKAEILQRLGVGSVLYVFALAFVLWAAAKPLTIEKLTYEQVFIFVCLVSPPGLIYAIPVERFLTPEAARVANLTFLAVVAAWRVALLVFYLLKIVGLRGWVAAVAALFPLSIIMSLLTVFHVLDSIATGMAGLREGQPKEDESFTAVILWLGLVAMAAFLPLVGAHSYLANQCAAERKARLMETTGFHHEV